MSTLKILLVVVFGVVAVMKLTAAIHLVAPYVAAFIVLSILLWFLISGEPGPSDKPPKD